MIIETSKAYGFTIGHCKSGLFNLIKNTDTDPEAAFKLGMMYLKGQNVEQNTHKAMFYLNQARYVYRSAYLKNGFDKLFGYQYHL